jgi:hypothetical protein
MTRDDNATTSWRNETKREAARQDDETTRGRRVER